MVSILLSVMKTPAMSLLFSFGTLLAAITPTLLAQAPGALFDRWDVNQDGKLSRDELPEPMRRHFDRIDADKDGFVSRAEHETSLANRAKGGAPGKGPKGGPRLPEGVKKIADLDYAGNGNSRQTLDLFLPEKRDGEEPLPVIVFIHGGGWQGGDKNGGGGRLAPYLATGKYAGASVGYRLTDEAQWPSQIHDCKAAIRWIKAHAEEHGLDPDRIAVMGTSAGGHLVAMLGVSHGVAELEGTIGAHTDEDAKVKCVVNYFGPAEMLTMGGSHDAPGSPEAKLIGGPLQENPDKAKNASPVEHVTPDDAPMLLVHGSEDGVVPYAQSLALKATLDAAGVPTVLLTVEGGGHGQHFGPSVADFVGDYLGEQLLGESREVADRTVKAGE